MTDTKPGPDLEGLEALRQEFAKGTIGKLPKPYKKDSPRAQCRECGGYHGLPAVHLDYVGHAAVTDRLLSIDPLWTWEPMAFDQFGSPMCDQQGNLWIRLTVCGVTRVGCGDGNGMKEKIGDAIRNAAMRFGVALSLWSKEELESGMVTEPGHERTVNDTPDDHHQPEPRQASPQAQQQQQERPKTAWELARKRAWDATAFRATSQESREALWREFLATVPEPKIGDFDRKADEWAKAAPRPTVAADQIEKAKAEVQAMAGDSDYDRGPSDAEIREQYREDTHRSL